MVEVPTDGDPEPATITEGSFEVEYDVDADSAGEFLIDLGEQLQQGDEVLVSGDDWEIPFAFEEPVELEIEFEGDDEPELEIEVELEGPEDEGIGEDEAEEGEDEDEAEESDAEGDETAADEDD